MPVYQMPRPIGELERRPQSERRRVPRRYPPQTFRHWPAWAALAACGVCAALGAYAGWRLSPGFWGGPWIGAVLGAAVGGGILSQVKGAIGPPSKRADVHLKRLIGGP